MKESEVTTEELIKEYLLLTDLASEVFADIVARQTIALGMSESGLSDDLVREEFHNGAL